MLSKIGCHVHRHLAALRQKAFAQHRLGDAAGHCAADSHNGSLRADSRLRAPVCSMAVTVSGEDRAHGRSISRHLNAASRTNLSGLLRDGLWACGESTGASLTEAKAGASQGVGRFERRRVLVVTTTLSRTGVVTIGNSSVHFCVVEWWRARISLFAVR